MKEHTKHSVARTGGFVTKLLVTASLLLVLFAMLAFQVENGTTKLFDQSVLLWLNQHSTMVLDHFFIAFTQLGGVLVVSAVSIGLLVYSLLKKRYAKSILIVLTIGGSALINIILKTYFVRARPDLWEQIVTETSFSFPSGHSVASMALALTIIILLWRSKWRAASIIAGISYVILIGVSRMYLGVHYPTDVLGGWLLSTAWVLIVTASVYLIVTQLRAKKGTS